MKNLNKKGFTLIELLAVIVILAIVAAVTMTVIVPMIADKPKEAAETSAKEINKAIINACTSNGLTSNPYGTLTGYTDDCATSTGCTITKTSAADASAFVKALNISGDMPAYVTVIIKNCQVDTACMHFTDGQFKGLKVNTTAAGAVTATSGTCS